MTRLLCDWSCGAKVCKGTFAKALIIFPFRACVIAGTLRTAGLEQSEQHRIRRRLGAVLGYGEDLIALESCCKYARYLLSANRSQGHASAVSLGYFW